MPRVKRGVPAHKKHKKLLELAEGQRGARHLLYRDRRNRKRDMRRLWITRINAAARIHGITYSQLIHGLQLAAIKVDRKILADLAVYNSSVFGEIAAKAKAAISTRS